MGQTVPVKGGGARPWRAGFFALLEGRGGMLCDGINPNWPLPGESTCVEFSRHAHMDQGRGHISALVSGV
jgi:hypothetical protein